MTEEKQEEKQEQKPLDWPEFLRSAPPGTAAKGIVDVAKLAKDVSEHSELQKPWIMLYCASGVCEGLRIFECADDERFLFQWRKTYKAIFLSYHCRHCGIGHKLYAISVTNVLPHGRADVTKIGEWPPFGPHVPSRVISLVGPDRDLFLQGGRAENQGMGVGAFAYYRRVVENQKNHIIDEIIKVAKRLDAKSELIDELEASKSDFRFDRAVETIKMGIPEILKIRGHNPLTLLHKALSQGLHADSDAGCLQIATNIRVVLTELAERISQALKEQTELDEAVSRLLQGKTGEKP